MKNLLILCIIGLTSLAWGQEPGVLHPEKFELERLRVLPVQDRGRIKPFETMARESVLFLTGSYSFQGEEAVSFYLSLIEAKDLAEKKIIEVREPALRKSLGLPATERHFSLHQLEQPKLNQLLQPMNGLPPAQRKNLPSEQKAILELMDQIQLLHLIQTGDHLLRSFQLAAEPDPFKISAELIYNKTHPFRWTALGYLLLALVLFLNAPNWIWVLIAGSSVLLHLGGFALRVFITGFAPVTNMYGTMIWVSLGVALLTLLLLSIYQKDQRLRNLLSLLTVGSSFLLLLTEAMPLTLSPDLDPLVAVLRSNYWLTLHVLTITLSYAAFTVTMLIGNAALVRVLFFSDLGNFKKDYAHYAYRMIQLGCFLLTVGIILGGVWADASWGRFWGWDPKETWALIADLGFLAILHARTVGWVRDFSLLAWSTIAYLLVGMAWYGVNFILASGLHSYGFSSGGALAVGSFVAVQLGLFAAAWLKFQSLQKPEPGPNN